MKKVYKIVAILVTFTLLFSVTSSVFTVSAASSAKFTTEKISKSATYENGVYAKTYYKKVVLKGKTKAIKKINKVLNKDCTKFINSKSVKDLHSYAKSATYVCDGGEIYCCYANQKVKYNKKNIISISVTTVWYAGGVCNTNRYGYTFNLKTGKKLSLKKVCKLSNKKIKSTLKKKILKSDPNINEEDIKINVKKLEFYLKPNNKAVICFGPYELGSGGWYRTFCIKSKYK